MPPGVVIFGLGERVSAQALGDLRGQQSLGLSSHAQLVVVAYEEGLVRPVSG